MPHSCDVALAPLQSKAERRTIKVAKGLAASNAASKVSPPTTDERIRLFSNMMQTVVLTVVPVHIQRTFTSQDFLRGCGFVIESDSTEAFHESNLVIGPGGCDDLHAFPLCELDDHPAESHFRILWADLKFPTYEPMGPAPEDTNIV